MWKQLFSSDHHFSHFKGVAVFCRSTFPLCSNTFVVMSPHFLAVFANPFSVEFPSRDCFCPVYRKPIPSSGTSCGQFEWTLPPCLSMRHAVSRGCVLVRVLSIVLTLSQSLRMLDPQCSTNFLWPLHHQGQQWPWLDRKGAVRFLLPLLRAGPGLGYGSWHVIITLSGAVITPSFQLLGSWHRSSCCNGGQVNHWRSSPIFFLCGGGQEFSKWMPHWGSTHQREIRQERYDGRRSFRMVSWAAGRPWSGWLLRFRHSSEWLGCFCPSHIVVTNASLIYWEGTTEETHQGSSFIDSIELAMAKTWEGTWKGCMISSWAIFDPTCPIHVSLPFWSGNHHTSELASEPAHSAHILVELLPDYSPAIIEGLGCSLILHGLIPPQSECLLL